MYVCAYIYIKKTLLMVIVPFVFMRDHCKITGNSELPSVIPNAYSITSEDLHMTARHLLKTRSADRNKHFLLLLTAGTVSSLFQK